MKGGTFLILTVKHFFAVIAATKPNKKNWGMEIKIFRCFISVCWLSKPSHNRHCHLPTLCWLTATIFFYTSILSKLTREKIRERERDAPSMLITIWLSSSFSWTSPQSIDSVSFFWRSPICKAIQCTIASRIEGVLLIFMNGRLNWRKHVLSLIFSQKHESLSLIINGWSMHCFYPRAYGWSTWKYRESIRPH